MNKMTRNFILDIGLLMLLVVNLSTLGGGGSRSSFGVELKSHLHIISGTGLILVSLVHIALHIPWFRAVVTGKAKGQIKLVMYCMVTSFFLLAFISGLFADTSIAAGRFHRLTGSLVVVGLAHHILKHARWMVFAGKKIIAGRQDNAGTTISREQVSK
jgi:hypothetical protein